MSEMSALPTQVLKNITKGPLMCSLTCRKQIPQNKSVLSLRPTAGSIMSNSTFLFNEEISNSHYKNMNGTPDNAVAVL